jgi:ribulose-5-phosphate 4-epimerase/fuculose-1-phosphate aldolase
MDQGTTTAVCEALRFLTATGVVDYNGHVSQRLPSGGFIINGAASNRAAPTQDQLSVVDADGSYNGPRPPNEVTLHAAIYRARPDVAAVVHGHPDWLTTLSSARQPLLPVMAQGCLVHDMPVYAQAHSISTAARGDAVAALLGGGVGVILQGHGVVTVGPDLLTAAVRAFYAEQNAQRQVRAAPLGGAQPLTDDEVAEYRQTLDSPALFRKCWDFYLGPER